MTKSSDKVESFELEQALMLRKKYKAYLKKNHVYISAHFQYVWNVLFFTKVNLARALFFFALALLTSPTKISTNMARIKHFLRVFPKKVFICKNLSHSKVNT